MKKFYVLFLSLFIISSLQGAASSGDPSAPNPAPTTEPLDLDAFLTDIHSEKYTFSVSRCSSNKQCCNT